MGIIKKYVIPGCIAVVLWIYGGMRLALDLVGWSTAPDDIGVAVSRLDQLFAWLMSIPVWMPFLAATVLTGLMVLMTRPAQMVAQIGRTAPPILVDKPKVGTTWAKGLSSISIEHAACAFAGIEPGGFAVSIRAQVLANDILAKVQGGYLRTAAEAAASPGYVLAERGPSFSKKLATLGTQIDVRTLEPFFARGRTDIQTDWLQR